MDEKDIRSTVSRNLRRLRENARMSQLDLAHEADLAHTFISDIENGKKWVSTKSLAKLAVALNAAPYQFFVSEPKYADEGAEIFLNDLSDSFERLFDEYRSRLAPGKSEAKETDEKKNRGI